MLPPTSIDVAGDVAHGMAAAVCSLRRRLPEGWTRREWAATTSDIASAPRRGPIPATVKTMTTAWATADDHACAATLRPIVAMEGLQEAMNSNDVQTTSLRPSSDVSAQRIAPSRCPCRRRGHERRGQSPWRATGTPGGRTVRAGSRLDGWPSCGRPASLAVLGDDRDQPHFTTVYHFFFSMLECFSRRAYKYKCSVWSLISLASRLRLDVGVTRLPTALKRLRVLLDPLFVIPDCPVASCPTSCARRRLEGLCDVDVEYALRAAGVVESATSLQPFSRSYSPLQAH